MSAELSGISQRTLLLCAAAALFEGFDNQSIGVAAPQIALEFALSSSQKGLIFSAAPLGLFIGAMVGGRAADHVGRKRVLVTSLLLLGLCSLLTAIATGSVSLAIARLLTGLGLGGAMPNFIALTSESAHPSRRLSAGTVVMAGMPMGGALASLIAVFGFHGWGWRTIFYVGGIAPVVLAFIMVFLLLEQRPTRGALTPRVESVTRALFSAGRAGTTALLWAGFFFTQLVLLLMLNWLPSLLVALGLTRAQASWCAVIFNLSGSLGATLLGRLHAGKRRRYWVVVTYLGIALALVAVASVRQSFAWAALACSVAGGFVIGAQLILFALAPLYYGRTIRGTGVGAAVAVGRLGSVVGPAFAGILLAGGGTGVTVLVSIVPFVAIAGAAAVGLSRRQQCADFEA
jgi:AAHS family 3-hydroxyphenylpropionic acid transporter